ncbi:MAG: hypothetical protein ACLFTI_04030 [Anaerolineales bacterium]
MKQAFKSPIKSRITLIVLAIFSIWLTSCAGAVEMDITVYSGDRYQQKMILSFTEEMVELSGGTEEIERLLDEMVSEAENEGASISWQPIKSRQDDTIQYEIQQEITDITNASTDGFKWEEVEHNNSPAYRFEYTDISDMDIFQEFTLTLHTGKILESNGEQVNARTAQWKNSNQYQAPYAIVQPKSAAPWASWMAWLPLAAAGLLLLATAGIVVFLIRSGRLQEWFSAGISTGKWRVQAMKLSNERDHLEKDKKKLVSELGAKAWTARVTHPDYADLYGQLVTLDQQRVELKEQREAAAQQLQEIQQTHTQTKSEYAARINELQENLKNTKSHRERIRLDKASFEKQMKKARENQEETQTEIQSLRDRLTQAPDSDAPEAEEQSATLSNAIAALEQSLSQMADEISHLESEIQRLETEQQPLAKEVDHLEEKLAQAQAEKREALAPLDRQIATLQEEIKSIDKQLSAIAQEMTPLIDNLGPYVDRARPESPALSDLYEKLDQSYRELASASQQQDLLKARIGAADTGAVRNFYLFIGGMIVVLILIIILLMMGLR